MGNRQTVLNDVRRSIAQAKTRGERETIYRFRILDEAISTLRWEGYDVTPVIQPLPSPLMIGWSMLRVDYKVAW